jgi:hypothetical protein
LTAELRGNLILIAFTILFAWQGFMAVRRARQGRVPGTIPGTVWLVAGLCFVFAMVTSGLLILRLLGILPSK